MKIRAIVKEISNTRIKAQVIKISRRKCNDEYIINFSQQTKFIGCFVNSINQGDSISVDFNGIVALSYPPQIYAEKIKKL